MSYAVERLFPEKHKTDLKSRVEALERQMTRIERGLYLLEQTFDRLGIPIDYMEGIMSPPLDPEVEDNEVEDEDDEVEEYPIEVPDGDLPNSEPSR